MGLNEVKSEQNWYLLYSAPRAEKKLYNELIKRGFEAYLPLQKTLRQWSDRKKWVEVPLFNSYLFVYTDNKLLNDVAKCNGFVKFVRFENKPVIVQEKIIILIRKILDNYPDVEAVEEKLAAGSLIEIIHGPLTGTQGELIEYKGKNIALIRLDPVLYSLIIQIPDKFIKLCQ